MKQLFLTASYKRDMKRMRKRQKPFSLLRDAVNSLILEAPLPQHYKDHPLKGKWKGCRELHVEFDWLLIYHVENNIIYLDRTGSHNELLK